MCMGCMANGDFLLTSGILGAASVRVGLRRYLPSLPSWPRKVSDDEANAFVASLDPSACGRTDVTDAGTAARPDTARPDTARPDPPRLHTGERHAATHVTASLDAEHHDASALASLDVTPRAAASMASGDHSDSRSPGSSPAPGASDQVLAGH